MKITIGKYTVERLDEYNITVSFLKLVNKKGGGQAEQQVRLGYYGNVKSALNKVLNHTMESSDAATCNDLIDVINGAENSIITAIENIGA